MGQTSDLYKYKPDHGTIWREFLLRSFKVRSCNAIHCLAISRVANIFRHGRSHPTITATNHTPITSWWTTFNCDIYTINDNTVFSDRFCHVSESRFPIMAWSTTSGVRLEANTCNSPMAPVLSCLRRSYRSLAPSRRLQREVSTQ